MKTTLQTKPALKKVTVYLDQVNVNWIAKSIKGGKGSAKTTATKFIASVLTNARKAQRSASRVK